MFCCFKTHLSDQIKQQIYASSKRQAVSRAVHTPRLFLAKMDIWTEVHLERLHALLEWS